MYFVSISVCFFKQKTAYEMRIRDWSSDVCSSDLEKRLRRNFVEEFDTTLPRFDVMASLDRYPDGQTMGDLSRSLLVSKGNVTAIVRQLEAQKLVVSTVDPNDRRSALVALTEEGRHL